MAYALNYPNAPTETRAPTEAAVPKGIFARLLASIERTQMARFRRELQLYSPHLYETLIVHGDHAKIGQSDDYKLPFVK
ncbi:MAG TPA: hypothetical protein VLQ65_08445 [Saliniramus sp.]|nr:hypothetical protein [Saliniramus sp.]